MIFDSSYQGRHRRPHPTRSRRLAAIGATATATVVLTGVTVAVGGVPVPADSASGNGTTAVSVQTAAYSRDLAFLQGLGRPADAAPAIVLTAATSADTASTTLIDIPGQLTVTQNSNGDITIALSEALREEIAAGLEGGESISELVGAVIPESDDTAGAKAAAEIVAASLGIAAAAFAGVTAFCTDSATGETTFTAGPTAVGCGNFVIGI